jgi:hypothetical protein
VAFAGGESGSSAGEELASPISGALAEAGDEWTREPAAVPVAARVVAAAGGLLTTAPGKTAGLETIDVGAGFGCGAAPADVIGGMALVGVDPTVVDDGVVELAAVVDSEFATAFATGAVVELEVDVFLVRAGTAVGLAGERAAAGSFDAIRTGVDGSAVIVALAGSLASLATWLVRATAALPGRRTINVPISTPMTRTAVITPTATAAGGHGDRFCFCWRGRLPWRGRADNIGAGAERFDRKTFGGSNSIVSISLASTSGAGFGDFSLRGESFKKAVSALAKSRIEGKRSAGFFRIARSQIAINSGERSGRNSRASGGSWCKTWLMTLRTVPSNGQRPVRIW